MEEHKPFQLTSSRKCNWGFYYLLKQFRMYILLGGGQFELVNSRLHGEFQSPFVCYRNI